MADPGIPTMSSAGMIYDTPNKADRAFANFLISLYSQSNEYHGKITSLPYLLQQAGDDMNRFTSSVREALKAYLSRYFTVLVDVIIRNEPYQGNDAVRNIEFDIVVQSVGDTTPFHFSRLGRLQNGKFLQVINEING